MSNQIQIPLFPLQTVLFPGQLLPLQIFEERYKQMMHEVLGEEGLFGVVLIKQGVEVGGPAEPFDVGTTAQIKQVDQLPDGQINLMCVGVDRFKIIETDTNKPYLSGKVEYWPWEGGKDDKLEPQREQLDRLLKEYLQTLSGLVGSRLLMTKMPEEPLNLASLAGFALRISNRDKQAILCTPSLEEFVDLCIQTLRREVNALNMTASIPDIPEDGQRPLN